MTPARLDNVAICAAKIIGSVLTSFFSTEPVAEEAKRSLRDHVIEKRFECKLL